MIRKLSCVLTVQEIHVFFLGSISRKSSAGVGAETIQILPESDIRHRAEAAQG